MTIIHHPSPNHDSRDGATIDTLVLHYTGMQTGAEALERLCDPAAKVSAHYVVELDGRVFQLVDESERAWHAGVASWRGNSNINARSIGVEIVNLGHEWGYHPFPGEQMEVVAELCEQILARHAIFARNVIGHSDVAPARKQDPGELFDWAWLAQRGIGLWPENCQSSVVSCPFPREKLVHYGYTADKTSDAQLITAFQRHFRQESVNGLWDEECEARLGWLLQAV